MLQRCFKNNCIRIDRWFVHLEMHFCYGLYSSDLGLFVESHYNLTYTLSYPNAIFILVIRTRSTAKALDVFNLIYFWNTMIINTIFFVWIFYIGYLYQNLTYLNWTKHSIMCLVNSAHSSIILKEISCSINVAQSESLFLNTDTLFGILVSICRLFSFWALLVWALIIAGF